MHDNYARLLTNTVVFYLSLSTFGIVCFFCQQTTTASEDLMEATYSCEWYRRDRSFKQLFKELQKCMKTFVLNFQKENVDEFINSQVVKRCYNSYSTMSESVNHLQNL